MSGITNSTNSWYLTYCQILLILPFSNFWIHPHIFIPSSPLWAKLLSTLLGLIVTPKSYLHPFCTISCLFLTPESPVVTMIMQLISVHRFCPSSIIPSSGKFSLTHLTGSFSHPDTRKQSSDFPVFLSLSLCPSGIESAMACMCPLKSYMLTL